MLVLLQLLRCDVHLLSWNVQEAQEPLFYHHSNTADLTVLFTILVIALFLTRTFFEPFGGVVMVIQRKMYIVLDENHEGRLREG